MNKRKFIVFAFIIIATLCIGLGYAKLIDSIQISTVVTTSSGETENEEVFNVEFADVIFDETTDVVQVNYSSISAVALVSDIDKEIAELSVFNIGIYGESAKAGFVVKNQKTDAGYNAIVTLAFETTKDDTPINLEDCPFTVTAVFSNGTETTKINNDDTDVLTVTVAMKNILIDENSVYSVRIYLNATATQE